MSDLLLFMRESRRIFSICPECGVVHRLNDLQIAHKGHYVPDWLDRADHKHDRLVMLQMALEEKKKEYQLAATKQGEAIELPKLLQRVAPTFIKWKTDPRDVRTIFDPVEFVVFDGMNSDEGVRSISLVYLGERTSTVKSIQRAIEKEEFGWKTLQVDDTGSVWADDKGTVAQRRAGERLEALTTKEGQFHLD